MRLYIDRVTLRGGEVGNCKRTFLKLIVENGGFTMEVLLEGW